MSLNILPAGFVCPLHNISGFFRSFSLMALTLFALNFLGACKEGDHDHGDPYEAEITFLEPALGATLNSGDEMHMEVMFTSAGTIHNVKVRVIRESDEAEVFFWEEHVHEESGSYEFHDHVTLTTSTGENFTIEASTWDHDSEAEPILLTRSIHLNP